MTVPQTLASVLHRMEVVNLLYFAEHPEAIATSELRGKDFVGTSHREIYEALRVAAEHGTSLSDEMMERIARLRLECWRSVIQADA